MLAPINIYMQRYKHIYMHVRIYTYIYTCYQAEKKDADDEESKTIPSDKDFQVGRRRDEMDAKVEVCVYFDINKYIIYVYSYEYMYM